MSSIYDFCIVGGGITGLSTAYFIEKYSEQRDRKPKILLIEGSSRLGGKIHTIHKNGLVIEEGPDAIHNLKPYGVDLMLQLGLEHEMITTQTNKTFIIHNKILYELPELKMGIIPKPIHKFIFSPLLSLKGKLRLIMEPVISPNDSSDESLGEFIERRFGKELLTNIVEPLLAGIYATNPYNLSINALFPHLKRIEQEYGSLLIWALRNSSNKRNVAFISLKKGMYSLIESLSTSLKHSTIKTNIWMRKILYNNITQTWELSTSQGIFNSKAIILTTPAHITSNLIATLVPDASEILKQISYTSIVVITWVIDQKFISKEVLGRGVIIPQKEGLKTTAITFSSVKWQHRAPSDIVLFRTFIGRQHDDQYINITDHYLINIIKNELKDILSLKDEPKVVHISRWHNGIPNYQVGHMEKINTIKKIIENKFGNSLIVGGSSYEGIGIPDCIRQAKQIAQKVIY